MKKVIYICLLLFILMLGMKMGNAEGNVGLQTQINKFEEDIENGENLSKSENTYVIDGGIVNKVAKKSEDIVKGIVGKFKEMLK